MIPVSFVHESFPPGGQRVDLPVVPRKEEIVRLNGKDFVVYAVAHVVEPGTYVVFVYVTAVGEYTKEGHTRFR